jgi:hypothetical protein
MTPSIEKIPAELAWVTETPDPTNAAAATFDVAKKPDTSRELVHGAKSLAAFAHRRSLE